MTFFQSIRHGRGLYCQNWALRPLLKSYQRDKLLDKLIKNNNNSSSNNTIIVKLTLSSHPQPRLRLDSNNTIGLGYASAVRTSYSKHHFTSFNDVLPPPAVSVDVMILVPLVSSLLIVRQQAASLYHTTINSSWTHSPSATSISHCHQQQHRQCRCLPPSYPIRNTKHSTRF